MSKLSMTNSTLDEAKWPKEARCLSAVSELGNYIICEGIIERFSLNNKQSPFYNETQFNTCVDYIDKVLTLNDLKTKTYIYNDTNGIILANVLYDMGELLNSLVWWDRYETISGTMGPGCVITIKTALALFKNHPNFKSFIEQNLGG